MMLMDEKVNLNIVNDLNSLEKKCMETFIPDEGERVVFGEGPANAKFMLIGEAPGAHEAKIGRAFIGNAGKILNRYLEESDIHRELAYITNVVKVRPPGNRTPKKSEVNESLPFLQRQIELIKPQVVVCLGRIAVQAIINPKAKITEIRGVWQQIKNIQIMPTYHPSVVFHDEIKKELLKKDLFEVGKILKKLL
ncbi:uracil-DNA glycosylase [Vallitalea maricola]|uniref:Uracil-DNA glycosylase n=1 Tax=Vallitalea maricola TaxID=3074433 RepID=A0ACB5UFC0_9FIRM|nr:uracil-DNA glycosylase [Vallitalea sp. AN17-2]